MQHADIHAMRTADYFAVIDHLLTAPNRDLLGQTLNGPLFITRLEDLHRRLATLGDGRPPHADELQAADQQHDLYGAILLRWLDLLDAVAAARPAAAERARKLRDNLRVDRALLAASYREEADTAIRNREGFGRLPAELLDEAIFPGLSSGEVIERFIGSGEEIGAYLARRAEKEAERARLLREDSNLRHQAQSAVIDLRRALASEAKYRAELPPDLDSRLFGVFDQQRQTAGARARRSASGPNPAPGEEGGDVAGDPAPIGDSDAHRGGAA